MGDESTTDKNSQKRRKAINGVKGDRTLSEITRLDRSSHVTELARMLGGQTEVARKHAEALVKWRLVPSEGDNWEDPWPGITEAQTGGRNHFRLSSR